MPGQVNPRDEQTSISDEAREKNFDDSERGGITVETPEQLQNRLTQLRSIQAQPIADTLPDFKEFEVRQAMLEEAQKFGYKTIQDAQNDPFIEYREGAHLLKYDPMDPI